MITTWQAIVLGVVEGLTEFLPVSSTGHLILTARLLGIQGNPVKTFEVVIQGGALVAVAWLYRGRIAGVWRGIVDADRSGLQLLKNLLVSSFPVILMGGMFHHWIKARLFGVWPVVAALAAGGVLMIVLDPRLRAAARPTRGMGTLTQRDALVIGLAQCLALWPGTSRAMVTIMAGMWVGLPAPMAAEYSFLLALPSLGAAVVFDALKGGSALVQQAGAVTLLSGFIAATLVALLAIRGLLSYLQNHGLALFGWYRIVLAAVAAFLLL